jgi:cell division protein FtsZ
MSLKLNNLEELENTPAYLRRNVDLEETPNSADINVSKYTLTENENNEVEIKKNNSFLHENVD